MDTSAPPRPKGEDPRPVKTSITPRINPRPQSHNRRKLNKHKQKENKLTNGKLTNFSCVRLQHHSGEALIQLPTPSTHVGCIEMFAIDFSFCASYFP